MQLIRGIHNIKSEFTDGSVATIGNYDGVHLGHQELMRVLKKKAAELGLPSVVVVFEPQPEEFFAADDSLRISSLREKMIELEKIGIDKILVLPFNPHFAALSAIEFINKVLINSLRAKYLVIGDDFVFGHRREGGYLLLKKESLRGGFEVREIPSIKIDGVRVSSSLIRTSLSHDNLDLANKLLGRPYEVCGMVVHGDRIGHDIGFPTANVHLKNRELSLMGVYLVKIHNLMLKPLFGVANIGFRPTLAGKKKRFEVYILDFDANIYGKRINIEFCKKIRDEKRFESLDDLKEQIKKDIKVAVSDAVSDTVSDTKYGVDI